MKEEIKCPRCGWKPNARSLWYCDCGHVWNTFVTAATCPSCGKVWRVTQCLSKKCRKISPHIDWYADFNRKLKELLAETIFKPKSVRVKEAIISLIIKPILQKKEKEENQ